MVGAPSMAIVFPKSRWRSSARLLHRRLWRVPPPPLYSSSHYGQDQGVKEWKVKLIIALIPSRQLTAHSRAAFCCAIAFQPLHLPWDFWIASPLPLPYRGVWLPMVCVCVCVFVCIYNIYLCNVCPVLSLNYSLKLLWNRTKLPGCTYLSRVSIGPNGVFVFWIFL